MVVDSKAVATTDNVRVCMEIPFVRRCGCTVASLATEAMRAGHAWAACHACMNLNLQNEDQRYCRRRLAGRLKKKVHPIRGMICVVSLSRQQNGGSTAASAVLVSRPVTDQNLIHTPLRQ
jgi:hypothetical protein